MNTLFKGLVVGLLALGMTACGGSTTAGDATNFQGIEYPDWVLKNGGAYGGGRRVFYGVGSVTGIKNHALARTTADNRARADLASL